MIDDQADTAGDCDGAYGAITHARPITAVDDVLSRQNLPDGAHDGESAQVGLEHDNRGMSTGHGATDLSDPSGIFLTFNRPRPKLKFTPLEVHDEPSP